MTVMISNFVKTERGTILFDGKEYFSATWLAELHIPGFSGSRAGVYKVAVREEWPEIHIPGRGSKNGVKHFLVPQTLLDKINKLAPASKHYSASISKPLTTGSGQHTGITAQNHSITDMRVNGFITFPKYDLQSITKEGHDHVIHSEQIVNHLAFKREWLEMSLNASNCLALISVKDDSMEPTLKSDDLILTDTRSGSIENNSIYVLQIDNELIVKRIQRKVNGAVIVKSDNPVYGEEELDALAAKSLPVVGKVVWFGRRI